MKGVLEQLVAAAVRAPSGDNTQPWRFVVDGEARRIAIYVDETRDASPMNAGQRMARIAAGAALENLLLAAWSSGWAAEPEAPPWPAVAMVRLRTALGKGAALDGVTRARVTNRRVYDRRSVPAAVLRALELRTRAMGNVRTCWIADRERVGELGRWVGQADALMFGEAAMRRAFLSKVRFEAARGEQVEEGLSPESLELSGAERFALRMVERVPSVLLKASGAISSFARRARALVESASGLCVIATEVGSPETDVVVGRAMERAWLGLTARGLAVQPMMSVAVLENVLEQGSAEVVASLGRGQTAGVIDEFRALVPEVGKGRVAAVLRFGYAPPPSGRTGRLPVQAVAVEGALGIGAEERPRGGSEVRRERAASAAGDAKA